MSEERYTSFEEFWPFYVREHANKTNRTLHFIGTSGAIALAAASLLTKKRWLIALAPVMGYGFAWVGHFKVEKNRPATFKYPLYSLGGDFVMWYKTLTGAMQAEVDRYVTAQAESSEPSPEAPSQAPHAEATEADVSKPNGVDHLN